METDVISDNNVEFVLELVSENEAKAEFQEANSATVMNPAVSWAKFVLTDDKPNKNKQRIPFEEFPNLIKSGVYMPIKMALGKINDGHELSYPLGVITNLKSVSDEKKGNQIIGLAALWLRERPDDIDLLKQRSKDSQITLSWEILYRDSTKTEEGVEELRGTILKASTVVGRPAYGDRTPILAIAAKGSPAFLDELPDESFLFIDKEKGIKLFPFKDRDGQVDAELLASVKEDVPVSDISEELKSELLAKVESLMVPEEDTSELVVSSVTEENKLDELETLKKELEELKASLETEKNLVKEKEDALLARETELESLREFKASIEQKAAEEEKIASIKAKFVDAKIDKEDSYFVDNAKFLLGLSDEALEFMLQELVAFSSKKDAKASTSIPNLGSNKVATNDIKTLADELRKSK